MVRPPCGKSDPDKPAAAIEACYRANFLAIPAQHLARAVVIRGVRFTVSTDSADIMTTCSSIQSDPGEGSMKQAVDSSREAPTCKCEACGDRMVHLGSLRETLKFPAARIFRCYGCNHVTSKSW